MKNIETIKTLRRTSTTLSTLVDNYKKTTSDSSCDKYGLKFGGDDRFSVFSFKLYLDCHTGYYGNSSCSTFASVDSRIAARLLNKVLNRKMREILSDMAKEATLEANALHDAAKKELEELAKSIEECNDV